MRLRGRELDYLRALRAELGTAAAASALGMPGPSLRRILSTGEAGAATLERVRQIGGIAPPGAGIELSADELEEYADLWGVDVDDVESLFEELDAADAGDLSGPDLRDYIDSLHDALGDEGWDIDVSDLWDMYFGYEPKGGR